MNRLSKRIDRLERGAYGELGDLYLTALREMNADDRETAEGKERLSAAVARYSAALQQ